MDLQGTYTDIVEIGSGGGGTVFKAYHVRMQKWVVLKKIHDGIRDSVDIRGELDILKGLRHEYLPTVLDFIEDEGAIYTVMDYIPGESFESLLKKGVRFTQAQVVKYAAQLGEVLTYLHGQRVPVVHGDIKPANLMRTPEDNICLIDFDISQLQNDVVGRNMGYTPGFAPPEQKRIVQAMQRYYAAARSGAQTAGDARSGTALTGAMEDAADGTVVLGAAEDTADGTVVLGAAEDAADGTVVLGAAEEPRAPLLPQDRMDARSDIYSAGATLYAILCGRVPDAGFSEIVPVESLVENCSEGLAHLIARSMQVLPEKRFQSAEEFSRAVAGIAKVDRRYRMLVLRQTLAAVGCILGMATCCILAILGREQIGAEEAASYNVLVEEMQELRGSGGEIGDELEEVYGEAVDAFPDYAGAYYQKAAYLYETRDFQGLTDFISKEALPHMDGFSDEEKAGFYFLLANGCLEQDNLDDALTCYRMAVKYNPLDSSYYADYAIALARSGELDEAEKVLQTAASNGLSNDRVLLAQAEIAGKKRDVGAAEGYFSQCAAKTEDAYVMLRAYLNWGKLYDAEPDEEGLLRKAAVLTEGLDAVDAGDRAVLLEQIAQAYIDLGTLTKENAYNLQALETLQKIVDMGWDTYVTYNNIGILYETVGDYEAAGETFRGMLDSFGEDYRIYKRLAFLEMDIQASRENADRDYSRFAAYYDAAGRLFSESGARADSDMEMQLLDQACQQLEDGSWLVR